MSSADQFAPIADLKHCRILVSNDDGLHGPGLDVLIRVAESLSDDVWVVVPEVEQSGAGHSLTLHHPLRLRQVRDRVYAVSGTPTDCVLLAVNHLLKDHKPDLVLSGINRGGNLGEDVTYSGTVAAAMEGTLLGIPSIALSQVYSDDAPVPWATAETHAPDVIRSLTALGWPRSVLVNVNFPDVAAGSVGGVVATRQGSRKIGDDLDERKDPRGRSYFWIGPQRSREQAATGTDLTAVVEGKISVTPLCVDLTDRGTLDRLATVFPAGGKG